MTRLENFGQTGNEGSFCIACGEIVQLYCQNPGKLKSSALAPGDLRSINFEDIRTGNDLLKAVDYDQVDLAVKLSRGHCKEAWGEIVKFYKSPKDLSKNRDLAYAKDLMADISFCLKTFGCILDFIIKKDLFKDVITKDDIYEKAEIVLRDEFKLWGEV